MVRQLLEGYNYVACATDVVRDDKNTYDLTNQLSEDFRQALARQGYRVSIPSIYPAKGLFSFNVTEDTPGENIEQAMEDATREANTGMIIGLASNLRTKAEDAENTADAFKGFTVIEMKNGKFPTCGN